MELLKVKTTLPTIEANFDIVKQQLIDGLKTYDVIITAETVKDGKTMASEINKIKKAIKDQEKKALEDILGPGNEFKDKIKELIDLADEAREKITAQVAAYEEKTKLEIQKKVKAFLSEEVEKAELREPFIKIEVLDLVKLTAVTKTGNLTTATMTTIKGRVSEQQSLQLQDDAEIARIAKEKEDEIAKIREEARIEAKQNIKVHVVVDPPKQEPNSQFMQQKSERQFTQEDMGNNQYEDLAPTLEPTYQEHPQNYQEEFDSKTGEFYETPAFMDNSREEIHSEVKSGTVIITAEFEVDISSIPNITDEQLMNAIQKRLKAADVNNSTIVAIQRF